MAVGLASLTLASPAEAQVTLCYGRPITVLDMRAPTLVSGTALQPGAVYRFANAAPGIDVRVRIDALNNGATLATIDNDTGLIANFQPELAGANARSVDFTIFFYVAGTTTPISLDVAASGVDIDGDSGSIREYAEFSTGYAAYVLDNPTNLDVNASGPSAINRTRFESRTNFTAPGIDETATANIVVAFYTATSSFQYRIGALGTGNTTRLTSLDFACPNLAIPTPSNITPQDFGDAPAAYGNPVHDIVTGIQIGATNTSEPARYNSPTASADTGDDGVTFPILRRSVAATTNISVTGANGRLQAWFDWNGDGDFADAGEQVATNVGDNLAGDSNAATGTIGLSITPPAAATLTPTFARFRWSTTTGLAPGTTTAPNGEVEDYQVTVYGPASLTLAKSSAVYDPSSLNLFAVPGNDILYTITATNTGTGPVDPNSVFLYDTLPTQLEFYNGDVDGGGPATGPILFNANTSGLTFTEATDLRYSNLAAVPANFAACSYTPVAGYDPAIKYVCFNPKGTMLSGTPQPSFNLQFRTRIK